MADVGRGAGPADRVFTWGCLVQNPTSCCRIDDVVVVGSITRGAGMSLSLVSLTAVASYLQQRDEERWSERAGQIAQFILRVNRIFISFSLCSFYANISPGNS